MSDEKPIIIIKKKKKGGHGRHHGGAWKVAYADFVTAMMAFFLLLWLLGVTTAAQREGLADYFSGATIGRDSIFGIGHIFGSRQSTVDEASAMDSLAQDGGVEQGGLDRDSYNIEGYSSIETSGLSPEEMKLAMAMKAEENDFTEIGALLKESILKDNTLKEFTDQIIIDRTSEGLRIQIIDKGQSSMFPSASSRPYEKSRDLLLLIGRVIGMLPNKITVSGHTDSNPFVTGSNRDNWSLSSERANISRKYLVEGGVNENQISRVLGYADKQPFSDNPKDPSNRRISIILLRTATMDKE